MKPYYRQLPVILLLISLASFAPRESSALSKTFDEEFSEGIREHLWLDLRASSFNPDADVLSSFGGLVLDETNFEDIKTITTGDKAITYALSKSLDIGDRVFPDLHTLATLNDDRILDKFINLYTQEAIKLGADFLLLPDTQSLAIEEREVLRKLGQYAPDLFISPTFNYLSGKKWKRKELAKHLTRHEVFIANEPLNKQIAKSLKKLEKKPIAATAYRPRHTSQEHAAVPGNLFGQIYDRAIVYARNHTERSIPYNRPDLFLLTDRPFGTLHQELERYYTVHNVLEKHPPEGALILVDARRRSDFFGPVLAQYETLHRVLALISSETDLIPQADEFLYFPEVHDMHDRKIPQILYGAREVSGRRVGQPLSESTIYETIPNFGKLRYAEPEWVGLSSHGLAGIEEVAEDMILRMAAPGCQVTVIKNGAIVYDRAFGYLTYDSLLEVNDHTLYDVASVTKVSSTLLAVMRLYEEGRFDLDDSISVHLAQYRGSNKSHITIRQLLSHHSGLRSYEALWRRKFSGDLLEPFSYASPTDSTNDVKSYGFPVHPVMADSIRSWLVQSPLLRKTDRYHYSDLGFMILQQLVEELSGVSIEQYVYNRFYGPMGLHRTAFNPREKGYEIFEIAPTEYDHRYRRSLVWGEVHDRNAAIFGGVAGHAGLFASAKELAIIMQMILNDGYYAGRQYLKPGTIAAFNQSYFDNNRRALGWDKYDAEIENAAPFVSDESFGHTGFTGTMVWADPKEDLVYTFVSNRIYPDVKNGKLMRYEVREKIQEVIYRSILTSQ